MKSKHGKILKEALQALIDGDHKKCKRLLDEYFKEVDKLPEDDK